MATNKRKDAAALFELIDKSSLKVPKNAGALKIPSWWSSKANPPVAGNASAVTAGTSVPVVKAVPVVVEGEKVEEKGQAKLFEPPAAGAGHGVSPSIRPPGPGRMAVSGGAEGAVKVAEVVVPVATEVGGKNGYENGRKPFRPQSMEQGSGGSANREFSRGPLFNFSRVPIWAIVTAASLVVVVICLIIFVATRGHGGTSSGTTGTVGGQGSTGGVQTIGPGSSGGLSAPGGVHPLLPIGPVVNGGGTNGNDGGGATGVGGGATGGGESAVGQVYEAGVVKRSPELFYIVVASSVAETVARQNAKFLADHGVDVSLETMDRGGKTWYVIVSAKGYPSMTATVADRKKIVEIGHLTKDYSLHHKAWDDAYAQHLTSVAK